MRQQTSIVTGTGRSGTTLFLQLAAQLGKTKLIGDYNPHVKGGFEPWPPLDTLERLPKLPPIIKDPRFLITTDELIKKHDLKINHAFLLIREFEQASLSRIDKNILFYKYSNWQDEFGETPHEKQIIFYQRAVGKFIEICSIHDIPVTIINFPKFAKDIKYTYNKLKGTPMECSFMKLESTFKRIVKLNLINKFK